MPSTSVAALTVLTVGVSSSVMLPVPETPPTESVYVSVASGSLSVAPATVTVKLETPDGTVNVLPESVTPSEKLTAP